MKSSQNMQILEALRRGETLTQKGAIARWQCYRLGARIKDLRAAGHDIITIAEDNGNGGRHARYKLLPPEPIAYYSPRVLPPAFKEQPKVSVQETLI